VDEIAVPPLGRGGAGTLTATAMSMNFLPPERKTLLVRLLIALAACLCAIALEWVRPPLAERFDEDIRALALRFFADKTPETRIAIVDIDDETIRSVGPWPWERGVLADLVELLLSEHGARTVLLDVVLPEAGGRAGDARLAAMAGHAPLVLAQILDYSPRVPALSLGALQGGIPADPALAPREAVGFIANHGAFSEARCVGNIGYVPDPDGLIRRLPLLTRFQGQDYRHLTANMLACAGTAPAALFAQIGGGEWRIPYHKSFDAYTVVPAADILARRVDADLLRGRHVFVGSSSLGLGDRVSTPLAPLTAGVMVHAASLSALLDLSAGTLSPPWSGQRFLLAWVISTVALASFFITRFRAWTGALALVALSMLWLAIALYGAMHQAEWSITAPLWGYLLLLLLGVPYELRLSQRKTQRAIATLSHYVSSQVLDEILRTDLQHSLQPTLREVTVLIADIEGYTRLTSSLSLEDAARLTKDILECLTQPLLAAGGTLDKYSGDGLVAFWGAPLDCPEQADIALETALAMLRRVDAYNREGAAGLPTVRVRVGIESGRALVGDLGTSFRSTYTAVGDCINFASRLESAARNRPTPILIGPEANRRLKRFHTHCAGTIKLRGTETSMEVFSIDDGDDAHPVAAR
jgi:adenylate cyclase